MLNALWLIFSVTNLTAPCGVTSFVNDAMPDGKIAIECPAEYADETKRDGGWSSLPDAVRSSLLGPKLAASVADKVEDTADSPAVLAAGAVITEVDRRARAGESALTMDELKALYRQALTAIVGAAP